MYWPKRSLRRNNLLWESNLPKLTLESPHLRIQSSLLIFTFSDFLYSPVFTVEIMDKYSILTSSVYINFALTFFSLNNPDVPIFSKTELGAPIIDRTVLNLFRKLKMVSTGNHSQSISLLLYNICRGLLR